MPFRDSCLYCPVLQGRVSVQDGLHIQCWSPEIIMELTNFLVPHDIIGHHITRVCAFGDADERKPALPVMSEYNSPGIHDTWHLIISDYVSGLHICCPILCIIILDCVPLLI